jgi:hypothetical protein
MAGKTFAGRTLDQLKRYGDSRMLYWEPTMTTEFPQAGVEIDSSTPFAVQARRIQTVMRLRRARNATNDPDQIAGIDKALAADGPTLDQIADALDSGYAASGVTPTPSPSPTPAPTPKPPIPTPTPLPGNHPFLSWLIQNIPTWLPVILEILAIIPK